MTRDEPCWPVIRLGRGAEVIISPAVVERLVRDMLDEVAQIRRSFNEDGATVDAAQTAQRKLNDVIDAWAAELDADNSAYTHALSAEAQHQFIHERGYSSSPDDHVVRAFVQDVCNRFNDAMAQHEEARISEKQLQCRAEEVVRECVYVLLGGHSVKAKR